MSKIMRGRNESNFDGVMFPEGTDTIYLKVAGTETILFTCLAVPYEALLHHVDSLMERDC